MRIEIVTTNTQYRPYYHFHGYFWKPEGDVKAVIHVVHGMTEHMGRYEEFAQFMNERGIAVAGYDLRGHGRNDNEYPAATFITGKDKDYGWKAAIEDIRLQVQQIYSMCPDVPYYLLGFSLGSFLVRDLMVNLPAAVDNVILVGTGFQSQAMLGLMKFMFKTEAKRTPVGTMSDLTKSLAFDSYNKQFIPVATSMDWLCSDGKQLQIYFNDPLVRTQIATDLFYEMMCSMKRTCAPGVYRKATRKVPVLLVSGKADAVGNMGAGVEKCANFLKSEGYDVQYSIINGARHDVFHEKFADKNIQMYQTILDWMA